MNGWLEKTGITSLGLGAWLALMVGLFFASLLVATILLVKLPANYFQPGQHDTWFADRHPALRWTARILKNLLGLLVVGTGVVLLFTPGQGVLTILMGIMLLDFPGKRRLELAIVRRPRVLAAINRLRTHYGSQPLVVD